VSGIASASETIARADTVLVEDLLVIGDVGGDASPSAVVFTEEALDLVNPWNAGDLEAVIPSAVVSVNSRGESLLMMRGASERHVSVSLDGIPLTVPWDERADLSLIPLDGVASLRAERGVTSLLSGPNAVAGRVDLRTRDRGGPRTLVLFQGSSGADFAARGVLRSTPRGWNVVTAASYRDRKSLVLPAGISLPYHQTDPDDRTNTGLRQASALMHATRSLASGGRLALLLLATDAERGVAPEGHLDEDARFWKLPLVRRGLMGLTYERPIGHDWNIETMIALDVFAQDIHPFIDDTYSDPAPVQPGDDYERGRDMTAHGRIAARRFIGESSDISFLGQTRVTRHRESLVVDGPELDYSQRITSLAVESNISLDRNWTVRAAAGLDNAATPSTGDTPPQDPGTAPALLIRLTRDFSAETEAHLSLARRSRFPSLRELFSGALGRFVTNPDLMPERQDMVEFGLTTAWAGWNMGVTGFSSRLEDGIEKSSLGDGRFQRVNRSRIMASGLEMAASRRLGPGLTLALHHALLDASVDDGSGTEDRPAEDRPAHQGALLIEWKNADGWRASAAGRWVGNRSSADITDPVDGLSELGADTWLDLWFGRRIGAGAKTDVAVKIGIRNATDEIVWEQTGLPGAGRTIVVGVEILGR